MLNLRKSTSNEAAFKPQILRCFVVDVLSIRLPPHASALGLKSRLHKFLSYFFIILCSFIFSSALAQRPDIKPVDDSDLTDLIQESNSLSVLQEDTVQTDEAESLRIYGVKLGVVTDRSVVINARNDQFEYEIGPDTPVLGASFSYVPWRGRVEGGFDLNFQYLTQRGEALSSGNPVQLHLVFAEPSVFTQVHWGSYFTPRLGMGWGLAGVFQRGYENESTSTSQGYGFYYVAMDFNINEVRFFRSDLDWGLTLEHRASFGSSSSLGVGQLQKTSLGINLRL